MTDPTGDLQFERAMYDDDVPAVVCGICRKPASGQYWQWSGKVVCDRCRPSIEALLDYVNAPGTFARAAFLGLVTAVAGGVAYGLSITLLGANWAIVTIGIGYAVAKIILIVTRNVSGRRYQILAAALTFVGSLIGYGYFVWPALGRVFTEGGGLGELLSLVALVAAAPFHAMPGSMMSLLIIAIGVWEAWQLARPRAMAITGPFQIAPPPPPAPA
jgi:hypothetical protein